jgi:DNA-directed RNA polymerase I, II, and III subunit RPABC3
MADILFEDIFEVKDIDSGGKKFLRGKFEINFDLILLLFCLVSRIFCESESFKMDLILDVNTQIYPMDLGEFRTNIFFFFILEKENWVSISNKTKECAHK